jgi:hypothetical protein
LFEYSLMLRKMPQNTFVIPVKTGIHVHAEK